MLSSAEVVYEKSDKDSEVGVPGGTGVVRGMEKAGCEWRGDKIRVERICFGLSSK